MWRLITNRRQFLASAAVGLSLTRMSGLRATEQSRQEDRTFATPEEARKSPREELAYVTCVSAGTGAEKADYLATVDLEPGLKDLFPGGPSLADAEHRRRIAPLRLECMCQLPRHPRPPISHRPRLGIGSYPHHRYREPDEAEISQGDRTGGSRPEDSVDRAAHRSLPVRWTCDDLHARRTRNSKAPAASCCSTKTSTLPAVGRPTRKE